MIIDFTEKDEKEVVFKRVADYLHSLDIQYITVDKDRPWGGFFVINEEQAEKFIQQFFPDINPEDIDRKNRLSPKILIVAANKRLSWQYHHRRAEIWKVIGGEAAIVRSNTDQQTDIEPLYKGSLIKLKKGERHRLIGTAGWGIVAEIWQHTDAENPSDENDIVRLQDDFGR